MNGQLDLIGLELEHAIKYCHEQKLEVEVTITKPAKFHITSDRLRVVRYKFAAGKSVLTAVFEYTKKGGNRSVLQSN